MLKKYFTEIILALSTAFMVYYPAKVGVFVLLIALAFIGILKVLETKEHPDVTKLKEQMKDVTNNVERLLLRANR